MTDQKWISRPKAKMDCSVEIDVDILAPSACFVDCLLLGKCVCVGVFTL